MARQREAALADKILAYLRTLPRSLWRKNSGAPVIRGWPDIDGVLDGQTWAFEVKRPGCKATMIQIYILARLREAGAHAHVVSSVEDVKALIHERTSTNIR